MPRWNKEPADYDAEIEKAESKVAKYTQLLSDAKEHLQELQSKKRDAALQKIYTFMFENNMTPEQVIEQLQPSADAVAATADTAQQEI